MATVSDLIAMGGALQFEVVQARDKVVASLVRRKRTFNVQSVPPEPVAKVVEKREPRTLLRPSAAGSLSAARKQIYVPQLNNVHERTVSRSEAQYKLESALYRFMKDPNVKTSMKLTSLMHAFEAKYKVAGNSAYVTVYQGGLPSLGKRS